MASVYRSLGYKRIELVDAINVAPYVPNRLGRMGLFEQRGVSTTHVEIEYKQGKLSLLSTRERGSRQAPYITEPKGKSFIFRIPHIPQETTIRPDDLPDRRLWGTADGKVTIRTVMAGLMKDMRQNFAATEEWHRMGALNGIIIEPDGTELWNLFNIYGITQQEYTVDLVNDTGKAVRKLAQQMVRQMGKNLGNSPMTGLHALCGDTFFDALVDRNEFDRAFELPREGAFYRENLVYQAIEYAGIIWENYKGYIGDHEFIATNEARIFPVGAPGLFRRWDGPDDTMNGVGRVGKPITITTHELPHDAGTEIRAQMNSLHLCTRPSCLFKVTHEEVAPTSS